MKRTAELIGMEDPSEKSFFDYVDAARMKHCGFALDADYIRDYVKFGRKQRYEEGGAFITICLKNPYEASLAFVEKHLEDAKAVQIEQEGERRGNAFAQEVKAARRRMAEAQRERTHSSWGDED